MTKVSLLDRGFGLKILFWLLHVYDLLANGEFVCTAYYLYAEVLFTPILGNLHIGNRLSKDYGGSDGLGIDISMVFSALLS